MTSLNPSASLKKPITKVIQKKILLQRAHSFFDFLEHQEGFIPKSHLVAIGFDNNSVNTWIDLVSFIQSQPSLLVQKIGRYTTVKLIKSSPSRSWAKSLKHDRKRSLLERVHSIFSYLAQQSDSVYVTDLKKIGLDVHRARMWLQIIQLIQTKQLLVVQKTGRFTNIRLERDPQ